MSTEKSVKLGERKDRHQFPLLVVHLLDVTNVSMLAIGHTSARMKGSTCHAPRGHQETIVQDEALGSPMN